MKKDKKPDTLAVIDNFNFCDIQTDRQTDGHGDSMTDPVQRAESVKTCIGPFTLTAETRESKS